MKIVITAPTGKMGKISKTKPKMRNRVSKNSPRVNPNSKGSKNLSRGISRTLKNSKTTKSRVRAIKRKMRKSNLNLSKIRGIIKTRGRIRGRHSLKNSPKINRKTTKITKTTREITRKKTARTRTCIPWMAICTSI